MSINLVLSIIGRRPRRISRSQEISQQPLTQYHGVKVLNRALALPERYYFILHYYLFRLKHTLGYLKYTFVFYTTEFTDTCADSLPERFFYCALLHLQTKPHSFIISMILFCFILLSL